MFKKIMIAAFLLSATMSAQAKELKILKCDSAVFEKSSQDPMGNNPQLVSPVSRKDTTILDTGDQFQVVSGQLKITSPVLVEVKEGILAGEKVIRDINIIFVKRKDTYQMTGAVPGRWVVFGNCVDATKLL